MPLWNPPTDRVSPDERVGRRLFDEPMLVGARDQRSYAGLLLRHFEETRDDKFSVDRLGATGVNRKVVAYLRPRASAAGEKHRPPKAFNGWAVLTVRKLTAPPTPEISQLPVVASPIDGEDIVEIDRNPYHAHIVLPRDIKRLHLALCLRHLFTTYGTVQKREEDRQNLHRTLGKVWSWLAKLARKK